MPRIEHCRPVLPIGRLGTSKLPSSAPPAEGTEAFICVFGITVVTPVNAALLRNPRRLMSELINFRCPSYFCMVSVTSQDHYILVATISEAMAVPYCWSRESSPSPQPTPDQEGNHVPALLPDYRTSET